MEILPSQPRRVAVGEGPLRDPARRPRSAARRLLVRAGRRPLRDVGRLRPTGREPGRSSTAFNRNRAGSLLPGRFGSRCGKSCRSGRVRRRFPRARSRCRRCNCSTSSTPPTVWASTTTSGSTRGATTRVSTRARSSTSCWPIWRSSSSQDDGYRLGQGEATDVLALSFSAQDVVVAPLRRRVGREPRRAAPPRPPARPVVRRVRPQACRRARSCWRSLRTTASRRFPRPRVSESGEPKGGRLVPGSRAYPNFLERLNRLLVGGAVRRSAEPPDLRRRRLEHHLQPPRPSDADDRRALRCGRKRW